jgi:cytochrome oxidase Cu insertion factor (SCO1/SenC/PrrC family)
VKRPTSRQRRLVILSLAAITFGLAFYGGSKYKNQQQSAPPIAGVSILPPAPLPRLENDSDTATAISEAALRNHWSLLMLDPQRNEDRSPGLIRLLQIHNRLANEPALQQQLHYLYLPVAPDEKKIQALGSLGDNIRGLTIPPAQIDELFQLFGVDPQGNEATLYLIGPDARLHALFTPGEDAANIAEDLTTLLTTPP